MSTAEVTYSAESDPTGDPTVGRGILSRLMVPAIWIGVLVLIAGSVVRCTVADRWLPFSALYYATPPAVLAALAAGMALINLRCRNRFLLRVSAIAFLFWGGWTLLHEYRFSTPAVAKEHQPVMLWNLCSGDLGWSRVLSQIEAADPSILAIVEGGEEAERFREHFPRHTISEPWMGLAILAKGQISEVAHKTFENGLGRYLSAWVESGEQAYRVLVIDLDSNPFRSKATRMRVLAELVSKHQHEPLLVLGDFNTPRDSVHFQWLRDAGLSHGYEVAGKGYANTWPYPLAVLQLDHFWFNKHVSLSKCENLGSYSDHKIVLSHCKPAE